MDTDGARSDVSDNAISTITKHGWPVPKNSKEEV